MRRDTCVVGSHLSASFNARMPSLARVYQQQGKSMRPDQQPILAPLLTSIHSTPPFTAPLDATNELTPISNASRGKTPGGRGGAARPLGAIFLRETLPGFANNLHTPVYGPFLHSACLFYQTTTVARPHYTPALAGALDRKQNDPKWQQTRVGA